MDEIKIIPFSLAPADVGYRNQILGAFNAIANLQQCEFKEDDLFILPDDSENYSKVKKPIFFTQFKSYKEFKAKLFLLFDKYFEKSKNVPNVFVTAFNPTESIEAGRNADVLCRCVKEYYKLNNLGVVKTVVLTSKYYRYRYVDLINIPKHLMTFSLRIRLIRNKNLRKKVLITLGTINNFTREKVEAKYQELRNFMDSNKDAKFESLVDKLKHYAQKTKKVVFCLGGRVQGSEIIFDTNYAQKLLSDAQKLAANGYGVVFVNGPRTPNSVTDYLYEKNKDNSDIIFYNCKRIAEVDSDRTPDMWRIYSGKYENDFKELAELGNIYPGILGFENTIVVHTMDSYSGCETIGAGIPTSVSCKGLFIDPIVRYDCINLAQLLCPKYAIDFDEFVRISCNMGIQPNNFKVRQPSQPLKVFAETVKRMF